MAVDKATGADLPIDMIIPNSPLLKLPAELRNKIYAYALYDESGPITTLSASKPLTRPISGHGLLQTCRRLRLETQHFDAQLDALTIHLHDIRPDLPLRRRFTISLYTRNWFESLPATQIHTLRHIHLHFEARAITRHTPIEAFYSWNTPLELTRVMPASTTLIFTLTAELARPSKPGASRVELNFTAQKQRLPGKRANPYLDPVVAAENLLRRAQAPAWPVGRSAGWEANVCTMGVRVLMHDMPEKLAACVWRIEARVGGGQEGEWLSSVRRRGADAVVGEERQ